MELKTAPLTSEKKNGVTCCAIVTFLKHKFTTVVFGFLINVYVWVLNSSCTRNQTTTSISIKLVHCVKQNRMQ